MYKSKVNDDPEREITFSGNEFSIDGGKGTWDKIVISANRFHILKDRKSYTCEVISADVKKKMFEIKVNGTLYKVVVKDRFDDLLQKLGMEGPALNKVNNIKAPMPGMVLKIMVEEGEDIKQGDSVLVLEAMKMENVIKSPGVGTIKSIKVKARDTVEKNQVLVELR